MTDDDRLGIKTSLLGLEKAVDRAAETDQLNERSVGQTVGNGLTPPHPPEDLAGLLEINGTVATACRKKARREVGFGFEIVPHDSEGDPSEEERERVRDFWHGSDTTWKTGPVGTPVGSPIEVLQKARKDFHAIGWMCLEVLYAGMDDEPQGLAYVPAESVRVKRHAEAEDRERRAGHGYVQVVNGQTQYFAEAGDRHNTDLDGNADPIYVDGETGEVYGSDRLDGTPDEPANELIFIRNNHPNTRYYGLPDHISSVVDIVSATQVRQFNSDFFENDAIPQYLFMVSGGTLGESEREDLRGLIDQLREQDGRRAAVIEAEELADAEYQASSDVEIEIEQLTQMGDEDMSFSEYRQRLEREIAKTLEVPPQLIGRFENSNRSNAREAIRDFTKTVIEPAQARFAGRLYSVLHQDILGVDDWTIDFETVGAEDEARQADITATELQAGAEALTVNEVRDRLGEEPIEELEGELFAVVSDSVLADQLTQAAQTNPDR